MLVVVASRFDAAATSLVERWRDRGACLLTCEGLSKRGWRHEPTAPDRSVAVLGGSAVPVRSIRGVVTRLPAVAEYELPHILPKERAYVAAEMTAFLLAWLASLRCPVLNAPTPLNLSGPSFRHEQWIQQAAQIGLSVVPVRRAERLPPPTSEGAPAAVADTVAAATPVIVVGARCLGEPGRPLDEAVASGARRLAAATGVELLTASFVGQGEAARFAGATSWVDLGRADVADALLERLEASP